MKSKKNINALEVSNLTQKFSFSVKNPNATWFKNLFWPDKKEIIEYFEEHISLNISYNDNNILNIIIDGLHIYL